jgi:hypothetical protein
VAQARAERNKLTQDRVALENHIRLEARDAVTALDVARLEGAELNVTQAPRRTAYQLGPGSTPSTDAIAS